MAFRSTYKLNPQDIGQKRGIGISILFNNSFNIFNQTFTTKDQVKANLIHFLLTNKNERLFFPLFGGNIRASLFEPDTSFDNISDRLENEIYAFVPNIKVKKIDVKKFSDENLVNIIISYTVNNQDDSLVLNVSTENLSRQ
jgi:phage baseplate assembly protein W